MGGGGGVVVGKCKERGINLKRFAETFISFLKNDSLFMTDDALGYPKAVCSYPQWMPMMMIMVMIIFTIGGLESYLRQ